jgi:phosphonate transport system permease protein
MAHPAPDRDPAARSRLIGTLSALVILWPLFQAAQVKPGALFDAGNLKVIGHFLAAFLPPETGAEFLGYLARATLETLAIATAGMALAFLLAVPLAYLATAAGREKPALNPLTRSLLTILRGIPELVWALVFVRVFGLGPAAGVLALGLTYGGMLAKVYAEIVESVDAAPARALRHSGASRPLAILYGLPPHGYAASAPHANTHLLPLRPATCPKLACNVPVLHTAPSPIRYEP